MAGKRPLVIEGSQIERLDTNDFVILGKLNLGPENSLIASNTINFLGTRMLFVGFGGGTQNVDQINGGQDGDLLFLRRISGGKKVKIRKNIGNILVKKDRKLKSSTRILVLVNTGNFTWLEVSWSG